LLGGAVKNIGSTHKPCGARGASVGKP
jgi:hypothetical protein